MPLICYRQGELVVSRTAAQEVEGSSRGTDQHYAYLRKIEERVLPFRCHREMIRLVSLLE